MVEILCEGNKEVGFGHIRRSLTLATKFRDMNIPVSIKGLSSTAQSFLEANESFSIYSEPKVVIFDSPTDLNSGLTTASKQGQRTVTLDWFGETLSDVNIVVYPHYKVKARIKSYVGFQYILIREDVVEVKKAIGPCQQFENVLVCLGGGDLLGQGYEAASSLAERGFNVTLIQGPLADKKEGEHKFKVFESPANYVQLLADCDWAVTNGGGVFFEANCLGKPTFVLPQTDWEMTIAKHADSDGSVLGIGMKDLKKFSKEHFETMIGKLQQPMIDGRGAERIVNIVKELL